MFSFISELQLANTVWLVIVLQWIYCSELKRDVKKPTKLFENCRGVSPVVRSTSTSVITSHYTYHSESLWMDQYQQLVATFVCPRCKHTLISGNTITTVTTHLPYNTATDIYVILQWQKKDYNAWLPFRVVTVNDIKAKLIDDQWRRDLISPSNQ